MANENLSYIIDNCVCENPEENTSLFYMELVEGSEDRLNLPNPSTSLSINLNN